MKPIHAQLIEQIKQQEDPFKRADLLHKLVKEEQLRTKQAAQLLYVSPANVSSLMRLRKLPTLVRDGYYTKLVSLSHLLIISRLKSQKDIVLAYEEVLAQSLTTAQTEELVREKLFDVSSSNDRVSSSTRERITTLIQEIEPTADVRIIQTRIKGKLLVTIKGSTKKTTKTFEELSRLLSDQK